MASEEIGTAEGSPSMTAMSSGPCDSPAVSTRSIGLVSHVRRSHFVTYAFFVIESVQRVAVQEHPDLSDRLMQEHRRTRNHSSAMPDIGQRRRPGLVRDLEEIAAGLLECARDGRVQNRAGGKRRDR